MAFTSGVGTFVTLASQYMTSMPKDRPYWPFGAAPFRIWIIMVHTWIHRYIVAYHTDHYPATFTPSTSQILMCINRALGSGNSEACMRKQQN